MTAETWENGEEPSHFFLYERAEREEREKREKRAERREFSSLSSLVGSLCHCPHRSLMCVCAY
jgi:hypothetical protein